MPEGANPSVWQAPDIAESEIATIQALKAALESGGSMGPDVVNMLRGRLQDDATSMAGQASERTRENLAARGINPSSPYSGSAEADIQEALRSDLSTGQREIDLAAAGRNFQDQLLAADALNSALNSTFSRATQSYENALAGSDANRANWQTEIEAYLGSRGLDIDELRAQITEALGQGGLSLDQRRLDQQGSQFDQNYRLGLAALLSGHELGMGNLGYQYTALNSGLLNNILQGLL